MIAAIAQGRPPAGDGLVKTLSDTKAPGLMAWEEVVGPISG
jgi:hypothetical protein